MVVDLKEKLEKMPEIEVRRRVVTTKKGTKFLVQETIIRTWTALNYIKAMEQGKMKVQTVKMTRADFLK